MSEHHPNGPERASVYITHELLNRPVGNIDLTLEKASLLDLAHQMANAPDQLLPRFVERAMEIAGGRAAGLSLLENAAGEIFVWRHVKGELRQFSGTRIPRSDSLCGAALNHNATVLARHPERLYPWLAEAGLSIPEVLLVPLYFGDVEPIGTLWIVAPAERHFHGGHVRALVEIAAFTTLALQLTSGRDRLASAFDQQVLIAREMGHRLNNYFTITDALIRMSAKHSQTPAEMQVNLSQCLHALARANALVTPDPDAITSEPSHLDLKSIIGAILAPYQTGEADPSRFSLRGPDVFCGNHSLNSLALLFHELATNAVKYGALRDKGRIEITWHVNGEEIVLVWAEHCDTADTTAPESHGFGSRLLETVVKQFEGDIERELAGQGMRVVITLKTARLAG
ncbi:histidine kinase [Labrys miyagiensis]